MELDNILLKNISIANAFLIKELKDELEEQGHNASGALLESLKEKVSGSLRAGFTAGITSNDYFHYLDRGTKPHAPPIGVLIKWAENVQPQLSQTEIVNFAYAVQTNIKKHGTPTPGSFSFSKNGRRKAASEIAITSNLDEFRKLLNLTGFFRLAFSDLIKEIQEDINKAA